MAVSMQLPLASNPSFCWMFLPLQFFRSEANAVSETVCSACAAAVIASSYCSSICCAVACCCCLALLTTALLHMFAGQGKDTHEHRCAVVLI